MAVEDLDGCAEPGAADQDAWAALKTAARLAGDAGDTGLAVALVLANRPGVLSLARAAARQAGAVVTAEITGPTISLRFAPRPTANAGCMTTCR